MFVTQAAAWPFQQAAFTDRQEDLAAPSSLRTKVIQKVKPPKEIVKCRPHGHFAPTVATPYEFLTTCTLPLPRSSMWQIDTEIFFARTKGHVRYLAGAFQMGYALGTERDVDLNSDLGMPEHSVVPTFTAMYRFRPHWGIRYSITHMVRDGSGSAGRSFTFGTTTFSPGQPTRVKWESLYQRAGVFYDPIRTYTTRVTAFGDYVRIDDKIAVSQGFAGGTVTMDNDVNMAMTGLEFERCLKTMPSCNTLSIECRAGVGFLDDAVGSDLSTGLKYSVSLNNGRWGFISGGYRYVSYKKKYSDAKAFDTAMEGGYLQMGVVF
jgi:hypothetical protein